jgi:hypothetical protein
MSKSWTKHELDVLHRQHIENNKRLFLLWYGVNKNQIDTESLPLDHYGKRVWISRTIAATKDEHYGPYSALHAFPVKSFTPVTKME